MRLAGGQLANEGRVEVCFGGVWGTICDDQWNAPDAMVVCRQLGYIESPDPIAFGFAAFGHGLTAIHLDDVSCTGNESRLVDCAHAGVGQHNCLHSEDAGVICAGESHSLSSSKTAF